jgi:hypothetical protein
MPKISIYQKEKNKALAKKAFELYKTGLTFREVAPLIKRSHTWVINNIKRFQK